MVNAELLISLESTFSLQISCSRLGKIETDTTQRFSCVDVDVVDFYDIESTLSVFSNKSTTLYHYEILQIN